jgi:hypothetical protein
MATGSMKKKEMHCDSNQASPEPDLKKKKKEKLKKCKPR